LRGKKNKKEKELEETEEPERQDNIAHPDSNTMEYTTAFQPTSGDESEKHD